MTKKKIEKFKLNDKEITFEIGSFALQANSSVVASCGGTSVLVTVVADRNKADLDYFPLFVEYIERLYAGGRIKGSRWVKKEGRPSDDSVLSCRLIDRYLRPLFPKGFKNGVQVIITLLSVDHENDPVDLALLAASAVVHISDIPWNGPVGTVRVGGKDGSFIAMPTDSEKELSEINLVVATGKEGVVMLESSGNQVGEDQFYKAVEFGVKQGKLVMDFLEDLRKKYGTVKMAYESVAPEASLVAKVEKEVGSKVKKLVEKVMANQDFDSEISSPSIDELDLLAEEARLGLGEEVGGAVIKEIVNYLF
ncbi:hypothetical protein ISS42_03355, partial [Candidatus Shapirobacteria bacterium]|nr:hypothetical protein [Candidatus Shapirobacteria bacterium]